MHPAAVDSIAGTFTRQYGGLDRLTQEQGPHGTVGYSYDAASRRTQMTVSGQSNPVAYAYDTDDRLTGISQGTANVSFVYDLASRRTSLNLPNGIVVSYGYDAGSQLTGINYQLAGASLGNLTYAYDNDGRRTSVGGSYARTGLPQALASASYDAANKLTQWGAANLTHDLNGNLTSDGVNNYTWDARNQLASISAVNGGTMIASFQYDAFGRRIQNTVGNLLLYDGANSVQEISGSTPVANRLTRGVDEFFGRTDSTGAFYPLTDALGSTLGLTDSTGAIETQYTYEPFGGTTVSGTPSGNTFEYAGRENDGTSLYYYRARYYSPVYQRFISEDPIRFRGGINLYQYAVNDPLRWTDPSGLKVYRCHRHAFFIVGGADVNIVGIQHEWIKTDTVEAGLGPARGGVPGQGGSDFPGIATTINDHSGESAHPGSDCQEVPDENEDCVNKELAIGKPEGRFLIWPPGRTCGNVVTEILDKCSTRPRPKIHIPFNPANPSGGFDFP